MADKFFFLPTTTNQPETKASPASVTTLLSGPPSCGKTSLLFQYAINTATTSARRVVFICNKRRLENKPPFYQTVGHLSQNPLESIHMKYIENDTDLKNYFAAFHLHDPTDIPSAVVIDDCNEYFDGGCRNQYGNTRAREMAMVKALALCKDAVAYANGRQRCELVIGETYLGDEPRFMFVYRKWMDYGFVVRRGEEAGSFVLSVADGWRGGGFGRKMVRYSVLMEKLVVEEVLLDKKDENGDEMCKSGSRVKIIQKKRKKEGETNLEI